MTYRKIRVGKNDLGWFVALPKWWGGHDVIDAIPTWEAAMSIADTWSFAQRFGSPR